jgi:uncharacterized protein (TIGR02246 family)
MSHVAEAFDFRKAVEKVIAQWEKYANTKDAAGLASLYAEDATLLPPGMPAIKGRQNIQKFFEGFFAAGASDARLWSVVWKKRQDGTIQLLVDMFNANA